MTTPARPEKWFSSPVTFHSAPLCEIGKYLPDFERRSFGVAQPAKRYTRLNGRLDSIVRRPIDMDLDFVPVGTVSKDYVLIPHRQVLDTIMRAVTSSDVPLSEVDAHLRITEYGERMELSAIFPKRYRFDPGDGHTMALRLECLNSVDGSTRFRALMGWFRFVCSNGLIIGTTQHDVRARHAGNLHLEDVEAVLQAGLQATDAERRNLQEWRRIELPTERLVEWVDGPVKEAWGFKAAARACHILRCGSDAIVLGPYKGRMPSNMPVTSAGRVPGAADSAKSLFDVSQALAWLAKDRRDVQEQLEWRGQVPELLAWFRAVPA